MPGVCLLYPVNCGLTERMETMTDFMAHSIHDDCFCKAHEVAGEGLRDVGEFHTWGACGLDDYDPARVDLPGVGRGNPAGGGDMTGEPIDLAERTIARVRSELAGAQWKIIPLEEAMSEITRPVNINLYLSSGIDDDEAERLAAILSEALDEHGFPRVTPDPVPEWRQFVDASPAWIKQAHRDDPRALAWTLENLAQVALEEEVPRTLARIVAICEAKVGDGWQADPDRGWVNTPELSTLLYWLAPNESAHSMVDWVMVGSAAARWLRDLAEGGETNE